MSINLTLENGVNISVVFPKAPAFIFSSDNDAEFTAAIGTVSGSIDDYEKFKNLPQIEGVTLVGNHTQEQLGINPIGNAAILALF